ncbi:hypothetical protein HDU91_002942 [Kappamyces sp. JEL0680]|nr:hypothetical protein HDU91_002942 [Kappamyces sp. JEL0680]
MWTENTQFLNYDSQNVSTSSKPVKISISSSTFHWNASDCGSSLQLMIEYTLPLSQIIGAAQVNPKNLMKKPRVCASPETELEEAAAGIDVHSRFWMLFAYDISKNKRGDLEKPVFRKILFLSPEGGTTAAECVAAVRNMLGYVAPAVQGKKILLILNPFGGTNRALKTYNSIVLPIIKLAGLEEVHEMIATTHPNHAMELGRDLVTANYRAAATISGDGVFHEFMNGLLSRKDWQVSSQLPIGTIGAGTSNALGQNLDLAHQGLATLALIKGQHKKMDVLSIIQNGQVSYSHLSVTWTLIADVDIESEKFRSLGSLRMAVMLLIRLVKFRSYHGKLYLLPADQAKHSVLPTDLASAHAGPLGKYTHPFAENFTNWPVQIESSFQYFVATNMPWLATDYQVCPHTKLNNGIMDVLFLEKTNRSTVLASFLDAERGISMTLPNMKHHRVKALVLEPGSFQVNANGNNKSSQVDLLEESLDHLILDVSGERVPYGRIQVEVLPSLVHIIAPAWLDEDRWEKNFYKDFPNASKI